MSEHIIDFDQIQAGDILDIRMKADGMILQNAHVETVDFNDNSIMVPGIDTWIYANSVEAVILKNRNLREFEPGIYISNEFANTPWNAIIWKLDGWGHWSATGSTYSNPSDAYAAGWQDKLVRFVQEVDAK